MKSKKKKNLQLIKPVQDPTDEIIDQIMEELKDEDDTKNDLEKRVAIHKRTIRIRLIAIILLVILSGSIIYLLLNMRTYSEIQVMERNGEQKSGNYIKYIDGLLRYGKDGAAYTNIKGKELWNQPYQMKQPILDITEKMAVVGDQGGNMVMVFNEKGLAGEIKTALPIEKLRVSAQGIVAAFLEDGKTPRIVCYDMSGSILVEHKAVATEMGYPLDFDISPNGESLLVSYLYLQPGEAMSKIVVFNFGQTGQKDPNRRVLEETYEGALVPMVSFISNDVAIVVSDAELVFYKGHEIPKKTRTISFENPIKSVVRNEKYIGVILQKEDTKELRVYNLSGKELSATEFDGEYTNIRMVDNQIVMYEGNRLVVFTKLGITHFQGETASEIREIFPIRGFNKYLLVSANGLEEIWIAK